MKWFLLIFFCFSLRAELPSNLAGPSNVNSILFREMRTYMFQVLQRSQFFQLDGNCRLYKYFNMGEHNSRRSLKFCLNTKTDEGLIEQELLVQITDQYGGNFRYIQEGNNIQPLTMDQFINFQIPGTKKGTKSEFYFDYFSFGLITDRVQYPETLDAFLQIRSFQLNIFEDREENIHYRNYLLSCEDCEGISLLKVQDDGNRVSYFDGNQVGEVTPSHFNQMLNFFIIIPFTQLGTQLKDTLINELRWPRI